VSKSTTEQKLIELRDILLKAADDAGRAVEPDWGRAKAFFKFAEDADVLRRKIADLYAPQDVAHTPAPLPGSDPQPGAAKAKIRKDEYPKYVIRGDALIRIGLSRDGKSKYEHVVPKNCFDQVVSKISGIAASQKRQFAIDDVQGDLSFPSYQTYSVVALFRDRGLLTVPRRGVYTFADRNQFEADARQIWITLSQKI
jgi:hypothetical protein